MAMRLYWVMGGSRLGNPHPNSGTLMPWGRPPQQFCTNRVVTPYWLKLPNSLIS
jgi:hypothetical protein